MRCEKLIFFLILFLYAFDLRSIESQYTEIWLHKSQKNASDIKEIIHKLNISKVKGAEFDVYYSIVDNKYYLTHDQPNKKDKRYLLLEDLNKINKKNIWLDFKNLKDIDFNKIDLLKAILEKVSKNNSLFIESQNIIKLKLLSSREINIIYNLPIFYNNRYLISCLRYVTNLLGFNYYSLSLDNYNMIKSFFPLNNTFIYTVNNKKKICEMLKENKIKVILSDIYFNNTKCNL